VRPATALQFAAALQAVLVGADAQSTETFKETQSADTQRMTMTIDDSSPIDDFPLRAESTALAPDVASRVEPTPMPVPEPVVIVERHEIESEPTSRWLALTATLAIGLLTGFASGFVVGQRDSTPVPHTAERAVPRAQRQASSDEKPAATAGQEFTDSNVPQPQVSDRPVTPAPEPAQSLPASEAERRDQNVITAPPRRAEPMAPAGRGPGAIEVDSRPQGARVFVDGRLVGRTPLSLPDVQPGAHAVRIDLPGYQRWVTSVNVAPGTRQRVAASLER
jgi:hypothetical protein